MLVIDIDVYRGPWMSNLFFSVLRAFGFLYFSDRNVNFLTHGLTSGRSENEREYNTATRCKWQVYPPQVMMISLFRIPVSNISLVYATLVRLHRCGSFRTFLDTAIEMVRVLPLLMSFESKNIYIDKWRVNICLSTLVTCASSS